MTTISALAKEIEERSKHLVGIAALAPNIENFSVLAQEAKKAKKIAALAKEAEERSKLLGISALAEKLADTSPFEKTTQYKTVCVESQAMKKAKSEFLYRKFRNFVLQEFTESLPQENKNADVIVENKPTVTSPTESLTEKQDNQIDEPAKQDNQIDELEKLRKSLPAKKNNGGRPKVMLKGKPDEDWETEWLNAKAKKIQKKSFCKEQGIKTDDLDKALKRLREKRNYNAIKN
jgi:hypothetical protein